jgi:hypothetical protein
MHSKLVTRPFAKIIQSSNLNKKLLHKILRDCYNNIAFSTFSYFDSNNISSLNAIKYFKSGNCIAMSLYFQLRLKKEFGIYSFLIPATIPKKYWTEGLLDICHVALAIPLTDNKVHIIDPAFYFNEVLTIDLKTDIKVSIILNNVHKDSIHCTTFTPKILNKQLIYNEYQRLPSKTRYIECYFEENPNDSWSYIMREVLYPDKSIGIPFLTIRSDPFICLTKIDENNKLKMKCFLRDMVNENKIQIAIDQTDKQVYNKNAITKTMKNYISLIFDKFIDVEKLLSVKTIYH